MMQSMSTSRFSIEKVVQGRSSRTASSKVIHRGDVVMIKLIKDDGSKLSPEVRYLSTHRGWWLKWVKDKPRHNGYFIISSTVDHSSTVDDTRAIILGSSFSLRHKRWAGFEVGVSHESSASFGGRLLGLKRVASENSLSLPSPNEDLPEEDDETPNSPIEHGKKVDHEKEQWLESITFIANYYTGDKDHLPQGEANETLENVTRYNALDQKESPCEVTVSAWVEVFDRSTRKVHRTYALKLVSEDAREYDVCLKTGKELVPLLQLGRSLAKISHNELEDDENEIDEYDSASEGDEEDGIIFEGAEELLKDIEVDEGSEIIVRQNGDGQSVVEVSSVRGPTLNVIDGVLLTQEKPQVKTCSSEDILLENKKVQYESDFAESLNRHSSSSSPSTPRGKKSNWLLKPARGVGKVGKKIGQGSVAATKAIGKGSYVVTKKIGKGSFIVTKKVGKGTVAAITGVARSERRSKKAKEPKRSEPKRGMVKKKGYRQQRRTEKLQGKDHHVIINKFM